MDDTKVTDLRLIFRDLSWLIGQQQEMILSNALVVRAIQKTLEGYPALSEKYAANLQSLKDAASPKQDRELIHQTAVNRASALLDRLSKW